MTVEFAPARTTWRKDGVWTDSGVDDLEVTGDLIRSADHVGTVALLYRKGYNHPVDEATAAELLKAGYGRQLRRIAAPPERVERPPLPVWATTGQASEIDELRARIEELEAKAPA